MPRTRIVIVGAGFAGFEAARTLRHEMGDDVDVSVVNPTDYFLYLPLLPEVAGGVLDPRRVTVPLATTLPGVRLVLGQVDQLDLRNRTVGFTDPEGRSRRLDYDWLVLAAGSVNKLLPIPGVADHAHGFRGIPEALYLRDHLIRQVELAADSTDRAEQEARCTFVVAGAGYTGTEVTAQGELLTRAVAGRHPALRDVPVRWLLVDTADTVLHGLDGHLSRTAASVLTGRGVELRTGTSVEEATSTGVRLSDGTVVRSHTLVWCVGVRPDPLVTDGGLALNDGRLTVDGSLNVPGHPNVFACGDCAAVPSPDDPDRLVPATAQHAVRQGRLVAHNLRAALRGGRTRAYDHHSLGFLVDLGGWQAAANPLRVPLSGPLARAVTRGYHLAAVPSGRARIAADWFFSAAGSRPPVQLGLVPADAVPLESDSPETPRNR